jgi:hypothetical protein
MTCSNPRSPSTTRAQFGNDMISPPITQISSPAYNSIAGFTASFSKTGRASRSVISPSYRRPRKRFKSLSGQLFTRHLWGTWRRMFRGHLRYRSMWERVFFQRKASGERCDLPCASCVLASYFCVYGRVRFWIACSR